MRMKKATAFGLAALMAATMIPAVPAMAKGDDSEGSVYYLNFKPEQADQWSDLAKKYTDETGVPVTVVTAASGTYESTLKSEMAKDEVPTLFQVNGPVGLASWKDYCYDLKDSDVYKNVEDDLGVDGAFTSAGFDSSSDWRFKTHLANLPIYYEYKEDGITSTDAIKGTYLDNFKNLFDLYITDSTCEPSLLSSKTIDDANAEFGLGEAVFYQNGTWAYDNIKDNEVADEDMGMLPIYIGVDGEEDQGLCTGSENYWCVNKKADEKDIQATLDFLSWVITSDEGRESISQEMGFTTPFKTFDENYESANPLVKAADEYVKAGKTPVSWNFTTMPSEEWKNQVGSAMLEYAQGTGEWDAVKTAFVDGWAKEYKAANEG